MPNVITNSGFQLNASYSVDEFQSVPGLILESWGPSTRNSDYNKAFDLLLERLQAVGFPSISVNVISRELVQAFPEFSDRAIKIDGENIFLLKDRSAVELRTAIGSKQARLKINPDSKGGNRTKRILLHSSLIAAKDWVQIAIGNFNSDQLLQHFRQPTADNAELEVRVAALMASTFDAPLGRAKPISTRTTSAAYVRDPAVKAWVLQQADGCCELCDCSAPFLRQDGLPYLEVHHVLPLAEGGSDKLSNAIALCPNCHRRMHHGQDRLELSDEVVRKISRLVRESAE